VLGSSLSFIDGTAVNVALPVLQRELHASAANAQWVVESYALFLSALILIGGSLGDIFGRRLVFGSGIAPFALASIVCALAPNVEILIAGRSLQGIGGALATPGSLSLIAANYAGESARPGDRHVVGRVGDYRSHRAPARRRARPARLVALGVRDQRPARRRGACDLGLARRRVAR
jgi:MFS family permease